MNGLRHRRRNFSHVLYESKTSHLYHAMPTELVGDSADARATVIRCCATVCERDHQVAYEGRRRVDGAESTTQSAINRKVHPWPLLRA